MPNSIIGSCMVMITDPQIAKEAFVTNTYVAGRPFGVNRATSQKIFNPFFPKAGRMVSLFMITKDFWWRKVGQMYFQWNLI